MKKILFYTANGVGLGHLRRTSLIAESIKTIRPDVGILFATMSKKVYFLDESRVPFVRLRYPTDRILENKESSDKARKYNDHKLRQVIKKFQPNVIVVDAHLFGLSFPYTVLSPDFSLIKKVLIFRKGDTGDFCKIIARDRKILDRFDKIILPHAVTELKYALPPKIYNAVTRDKKFVISGPIFLKVKEDIIAKCRQRYRLSPRDFLITVILGGGGELTRGRCENPARIASEFLKNFDKIKNFIPGLKVIISTGPLFSRRKELAAVAGRRGLRPKIIGYEKNLPALIRLSGLVISAAGYNTVNEIIAARKPAILIPLRRGGREQAERAEHMEKSGVARIWPRGRYPDLASSVFDAVKNMKRMRSNYKNFATWRPGNKKAAEEILRLAD